MTKETFLNCTSPLCAREYLLRAKDEASFIIGVNINYVAQITEHNTDLHPTKQVCLEHNEEWDIMHSSLQTHYFYPYL